MRRSRPRLLLVSLTATACLGAAVAVAPPTQARPSPAGDASVVSTWNAIAARTIYTEAATPPPVSTLSFALVHLAVYDAVVSIERGARPYVRGRAHPHASTEAAVATAAHTVLRHEFPRSAVALDADYAAFLAAAAPGRALVRGRVAGYAAALRLLDARADDGRSDTATAVFDLPVGPGIWRPTPPGFAPMIGAWLGDVEPFVLRSPTSVPLGGPDALGSAAYRADYEEVQAVGRATGSTRTADQTATALFWNANPVLQHQVALRQQVERRGLSVLEAARAFAVVDTSAADAIIACWYAKRLTGFWRPVTAIRLGDTDPDPLTVADPTWSPLVNDPPYPDNPSGHACVTGAITGAYVHLFGDGELGLDVASGPGMPVRHYESADVLAAEARDARVWLGIHFRDAVDDGTVLGRAVADRVAARLLGRR